MNRGSFNRPAHRPSPGRGNINRGDINRGDININRPVNIGEIEGGYGGRWNNGCCYYDHPVAAGAVVGAAAAVGAAAVGSVVYDLPSSCTTVYVDGVTYENCGGTYYQPSFTGTTTSYIVVSDPD